MSMGVGLEARVPFLDHKLVEFALSIPQSVKMRHGNLKHIPKKAVRGTIPDQIIDGQKQGFGVPVYEWFLDKLGAQAHAELKTFCAETDVFDFATIEKLFASRSGAKCWYVYNVALWWRSYIDERRMA